jgi:hypothetical protein
MNQQVAVYDPRQQQAPVPSFTMSEMERIALAIAKGRLFGSDDPNAVLTLCMVAQAEGKHPGLVMQQYHIIKGKPAKKAEAMLVDFLAAGGKVTWNKLDDECAEATFSHPLGGEVTINWTLARATKAGLMNNDTWKKYPRQMLRSRVVSEGVRTVYPGATSGMYVPEEAQDFDDGPRSTTPPTPQPKRARDLKRATANTENKAKALPEPKHDPETGEIEEPQRDAFGLEPVADGPAKPKQTADEWTNQYISEVADCATIEDLMDLQSRSAKALAKLAAERTDLHELASGAGVKRAEELQQSEVVE